MSGFDSTGAPTLEPSPAGSLIFRREVGDTDAPRCRGYPVVRPWMSAPCPVPRGVASEDPPPS